MFLVTLVLVSVVSHWYFAGWVTRSFPKLRPRRVRIVALVLALLPLLLRLLTHFTWHWLVTDVMGSTAALLTPAFALGAGGVACVAGVLIATGLHRAFLARTKQRRRERHVAVVTREAAKLQLLRMRRDLIEFAF